MFEDGLFNCAVVIYRGRVLGVAPKTYLPNYREFYEKRQFAAARDAVGRRGAGSWARRRRSATDLCSRPSDVDDFGCHVEICEDLWAPIPPSTYAALAGATVLANLSASNITIGKAEYRAACCASRSRPSASRPTSTPRGPGESTTDLAWDGHALIYENGDLLAEGERFAADEQLITADIDLERLVAGPDADDQLQRRRTTMPSGPAHPADRVRLRRAGPSRCPCSGTSTASRTCRPTRPSATSAASRLTTSRCTACSSGCRAPGTRR